jgi:tRNA-modifying protein YgfZ
MEFDRRIFVNRSERAKLRFTGPQRAWFLHQILTQSFEDIAVGESRDGALLTPHGRMVGYLEVLALDDALLAHFEPELRESLPEAIRFYVFATQVEIEDVTDETGLVLVAGPGWREAATRAAPDAPIHPTLGLGADAGYVWVARADLGATLAALQSEGCEAATEDEIEAVRIANGVGRWGRDMTEKTLPQEARLEDRAVQFDKGCYVGQEAVAKIHFRGKVNRLLRRLRVDEPVAVGAEVSLEGQGVGTVTSSAGGFALAMLRYTVEPGESVEVGDTVAKVEA